MSITHTHLKIPAVVEISAQVIPFSNEGFALSRWKAPEEIVIGWMGSLWCLWKQIRQTECETELWFDLTSRYTLDICQTRRWLAWASLQGELAYIFSIYIFSISLQYTIYIVIYAYAHLFHLLLCTATGISLFSRKRVITVDISQIWDICMFGSVVHLWLF